MSVSRNVSLCVVLLFHILLGLGFVLTSDVSTSLLSTWKQELSSSESPCDVTHNTTDVIADCRGRNIQNLSTLWVPMETSVLKLDDNCLTNLTKDFLRGRSHLRYLSATNSWLWSIEQDAFKDVTNLTYLNLEDNNLLYSDCNKSEHLALPPGIFEPLIKLEHLFLARNDLGCFSDKTDSRVNLTSTIQSLSTSTKKLTSSKARKFLFETKLEFLTENTSLPVLTTVSLDIQDFVKSNLHYHQLTTIMPNVENLHLNVKADYIFREFFQVFRHLEVKRCSIEARRLRHIHKHALSHFRHLETISLFNSPVGLNNAISSLSPFAKKSLREIRFDNVNLEHSEVIWGKIPVFTEYKLLASICVETLSLRYNKIHLFDIRTKNFGNTLLSCVKHLDLSGNKDSLLHVDVVGYLNGLHLNLSTWTRLEEVKLSNLFGDDDIFSPWSVKDSQRREMQNEKNTCIIARTSELNVSVKYPLPESLRIFNSSNSPDGGQMLVYEEINFDNALQLTDLDFSNCGFTNVRAVFKGLPNLKRFYFANNNLSDVNERFLDHLTSLEFIDLSSCQLGTEAMTEKGQRLFSRLKVLTSVDLSNNNLEVMPPDIFVHNSRIRRLNLRRNSLTSIPIKLSNIPELKDLDMRANRIKELTVSDRNDLDGYSITRPKFRLQIQENLFSCSCADIPFLVWLRFTRVSLDEDEEFPCLQLEKGQPIVSRVPQGQGLRALWRRCVGETAFFFSLVVVSLYITGVLAVVLFFRYKRYVKATFMKLFVNGFLMKTKKDYEYGVFIAYAERDYHFPCFVLRQFIEDQLGLTCFLRDRDLIPNQPMADSIVQTINGSWKTLLVITPDFLFRDEWGHFTAKMAVYAQRADNPHRVVVLADHVTAGNLPEELLGNVSDDNIISVPRLRMSYELRQKLRTRLLNQ